MRPDGLAGGQMVIVVMRLDEFIEKNPLTFTFEKRNLNLKLHVFRKTYLERRFKDVLRTF